MQVAQNFMGLFNSGCCSANARAAATTDGGRNGTTDRSLNDVLKLSHKASKVISGAEGKIASLNPANAKDAIKITKLEDKILHVLENLIAKAAESGITIIVEDPSEAVAAPPAVAAGPESSEAEVPSPKPKDVLLAAVTPKAETPKAAISANPAANNNAVEKLTGLERAAANATANGVGGGVAENAKTPVASSNANTAAKEQVPASKLPAPAEAAAASEKSNASSKAKQVLVIKAAVLREVKNFEDLISLISRIEGAVAAITSSSADDVTKQVGDSMTQAYFDRTGAGERNQQVRSLQTHKQVIDLIASQMDAISRVNDSNRKNFDFTA